MKNNNKVNEGSFGPTFKTTGKDNEGKERHGWSDFATGRLNKARERGRRHKAKQKAEYDAMTPEQQKDHDRMWADVKADKIEKMSRESVDIERWRSALESGEPVVLENKEIISLMRLGEKKDSGHKGKSCKESHPETDHEEWEMSQNESVEIEESYDKKGKLKKGLTHAVHSKSNGSIHFTTRRKKTADLKAKMYTDAIQFNQKDHPGFDIKIVPHGTPHGKSVHNESLGGPGGPSRQMSPNDMYASGLRTKALMKKHSKKKKDGAGIFNKSRSEYLAMANKKLQKKTDESVELQDSTKESLARFIGEKIERGEDGVLRLKGAFKSEPPFHGMSQKAWDEAKARREAKKKETKKDESVELGELKDTTLQSYMGKAHDHAIKGQQQSGKTIKRIQGFIKAKQKLKDMGAKTPAVIGGVIQGDRLDPNKLGTGNVYKPDTVRGESVEVHEDHDARELHLHADNDANLHRQRLEPIRKNLRNKMARGTYDSDKAHKAWTYASKDAADSYHKTHGHKFSKDTVHKVAAKMRDNFEGEAKDGDHDHHLHKKYKGHKVGESVEFSVEETERERAKRILTIMTKKSKKYPKQSARAKKMLKRMDEALRRPPRPSWDEIATRVAKRNKNQKPESDESKQKRWDKAGLNLHNISGKSPNYVHRNNLKFDPNTGKLKSKKNK